MRRLWQAADTLTRRWDQIIFSSCCVWFALPLEFERVTRRPSCSGPASSWYYCNLYTSINALKCYDTVAGYRIDCN